MVTTMVKPYHDLIEEINRVRSVNVLAVDLKDMVVSTPKVDLADLERIDELDEEPSNEWQVTAGVLTY